MYKIAYDGTYMLKGYSGIPTDAKSTLKSLHRSNPELLDVYFFDYYKANRKSQDKVTKNKNLKLSKVQIAKRILLRVIFILPFSSQIFNAAIRTVLRVKRVLGIFRREIGVCKLVDCPEVLDNFIPDKRINYYSTFKTSLERFLPVKILGKSLRLDTSSYDYFVQQQIDPISINRETQHIVRLHDILPVTHPHLFTRKGISAFKTGLNLLLKDNEIVWVMDTFASASEFIELFGENRKVEVIPCVVGDKFAVPKVLNKEKIFLMVNTIEPRKNVGRVIDAFLALTESQKIDGDWKLIIAGHPGWKSMNLVKDLKAGKFGGRVIFHESPNDTEISSLYERAKFVISASEAEGFGLPPLEGMKFGCIPIVSDIPQHRETIGEFGLYFSADVASLIACMLKSVEFDPEICDKWVFSNRQSVEQKYSLDEISKLWIDLLRKLETRKA